MPDPTRDLHTTASTLLAEGEALRALARSLLAPAGGEDADDAVQAAYLAALQRPAAARHLGPWLTGTVRRLAARWRRRDVRRGAREGAVARPEVDAASDPAAIAMQAEATRALAAAVAELDEPFRTVVVLRFWHGAMPAQIAQQLGVPVATVRSRLQRGLARLRERLDERPGGRDAWASALAARLPTTPPAAVTGGTAFLGVFVTTKLLAVLFTTAALAFLVPLAWPEPVAPSHGNLATTPDPKPVAANVAIDDAPVTEPRTAVASAPVATRTIAGDAEPPLVAPWTTTILVVDRAGRPVADATVWFWQPIPSPRQTPPGEGGRYSMSKRTERVLAQVHTDARGAATTTLDRECVVVRADHEARRSTEHWLWHTRAAQGQTLVVHDPVAVRGRVLRGDGTPAPDAQIEITSTIDTRTMGKPPVPAGVRTDADGRFGVDLIGGHHELRALLGGDKTFPVKLQIETTTPPEVVLTFPGANSVRGVVVDADGKELTHASVRVWREDTDRSLGAEESLYLRSDDSGHFTTPVRWHSRYGTMAAVQGQPSSEVVYVATSPERPNPEVRLVVPRFAAIRGLVLRADGVPLAGATVRASAGPLEFAANPWPSRRDRNVTGGEVTTNADGSFHLRVQPGATWTVVVAPDAQQKIRVRREGVASGEAALRIVVSDAELAGCAIRGRVFDPAGAPTIAYEVHVLEQADVSWFATSRVATIAATGFEFPPHSLAITVMLEVVPTDPQLATQRLGPFTTSPSGIAVDVRLTHSAEITLCVREADGTPARGVLVNLAMDVGVEPAFGPERVDEGGRVHLSRRAVGARRVLVFRDTAVIHEQPVTLLPGPNTEVLVTLPAATPSKR